MLKYVLMLAVFATTVNAADLWKVTFIDLKDNTVCYDLYPSESAATNGCSKFEQSVQKTAKLAGLAAAMKSETDKLATVESEGYKVPCFINVKSNSCTFKIYASEAVAANPGINDKVIVEEVKAEDPIVITPVETLLRAALAE